MAALPVEWDEELNEPEVRSGSRSDSRFGVINRSETASLRKRRISGLKPGARRTDFGTFPSEEDSDSGSGFERDAANEFGARDPNETVFLRNRRRAPVRGSRIPQSMLGRIALVVGVLAIAGGVALVGFAARAVLRADPRFKLTAADHIEIRGNQQLSASDVRAIFSSDFGRSVFSVPLAERRQQLDQLPWVESGSVMRLLPNSLGVEIKERTPVAFVTDRGRVKLMDSSGVLLEVPEGKSTAKYSFPVVTGVGSDVPLSTRRARIGIYQQFLGALDGGGEKISQRLSEVDISDPDDIRALIPEDATTLLVHFGGEDFLARYHLYQVHLAEWRQQYSNLGSVDLRQAPEVILGRRPAGSATAAAVEEANSASNASPEEAAAGVPEPLLNAVPPDAKAAIRAGNSAGRSVAPSLAVNDHAAAKLNPKPVTKGNAKAAKPVVKASSKPAAKSAYVASNIPSTYAKTPAANAKAPEKSASIAKPAPLKPPTTAAPLPVVHTGQIAFDVQTAPPPKQRPVQSVDSFRPYVSQGQASQTQSNTTVAKHSAEANGPAQ